MVSMSGWLLPAKVVLISAGVVSVAMGIKFSVPIAVDGIPALWSAVLSWMKPPYMYIIINGIIITIVASSRFHRSQSEAPVAVRSENLVSVRTPPSSSYTSFSDEMAYIRSSGVEELTADDEVVVSEIEDTIGDLNSMEASSPKADAETKREIEIEAAAEENISLAEEKISPEVHFESLLPVREKPLVSSRFGHRKPIRSHPEVSSGGGRALRVARPKRHETLENTWKMITEGRHVPLTRHQETLNKERSSSSRSRYVNQTATARIGKEASVGRDELNRRVEAFIQKFNEEMRMQRQESLNQYMEMINRAA